MTMPHSHIARAALAVTFACVVALGSTAHATPPEDGSAREAQAPTQPLTLVWVQPDATMIDLDHPGTPQPPKLADTPDGAVLLGADRMPQTTALGLRFYDEDGVIVDPGWAQQFLCPDR